MISRDLKKYESDYLDLPFEPVLIYYRRRVVIENINKYRSSKILEVGCGMEPLFMHYSDFSQMTVIEPTELFYDNAIEKRKNAVGKKIEIFNNTLEKAVGEIEDPDFDFIIVSSLLHELSDPDNFLTELYKLCHKNTMIHINVPNAESFHRILAVKSGLIENEFERSRTQIKMQQENIFNLSSLKIRLEKNGFKVQDEGSYFIKPFTHKQMQALLDYELIDNAVLDGLFKITDLLPGFGAEIYVNCCKSISPGKTLV